MSVTVIVRSNRIPQIRGEARQRAEDAVAKAVYDIEARAKAAAPVRTGFLKSSIQGSTSGLEGRVDAQAHYAAHVEFGTSRMGARPYLIPAAEAVAHAFQAAMKRIVR